MPDKVPTSTERFTIAITDRLGEILQLYVFFLCTEHTSDQGRRLRGTGEDRPLHIFR